MQNRRVSLNTPVVEGLRFYGMTRDFFHYFRGLLGLIKPCRNVTLRNNAHNSIVRIHNGYSPNLVGSHCVQGPLQLIVRGTADRSFRHYFPDGNLPCVARLGDNP